jgi:hypothetical protein
MLQELPPQDHPPDHQAPIWHSRQLRLITMAVPVLAMAMMGMPKKKSRKNEAG